MISPMAEQLIDIKFFVINWQYWHNERTTLKAGKTCERHGKEYLIVASHHCGGGCGI